MVLNSIKTKHLKMIVELVLFRVVIWSNSPKNLETTRFSE